MNRWLLTVAVLLGLPAGFASAYYVEIIVDLNKLDKIGGDNQQKGGAAGIGGASGISGGGRGMLGISGGRGATGISGGGAPIQPRGASGASGAAGIGGISGGRGMLGISGGGMAGIAGLSGGKGNEKPPEDEPANTVKVIVEVTKEAQGPVGNLQVYRIDHKWGRSYIVSPSELIPRVTVRKAVGTVLARYDAKRKKAFKDKDKETLRELAGWVLKHGLPGKFPEVMAELEKADPQDKAVLAYKKLGADMKKKPSADDPASAWVKGYLKYDARVSPEGHYTLLTNSTNEDEIKGRLQLLEEAYQTFFYWFALQGQVPQVPRYRLVAALLTDPNAFKDARQPFRSAPQVASGFTARRDNVIVFASRPVDDEQYTELAKDNQQRLGSGDRVKLLQGTKSVPALKAANEQVLALVQKVMEEEDERVSTSHEAARQLLASAGLPAREGGLWVPFVSRNLSGPEWARFGLASFFETPFRAFYPGGTGPSWDYCIKYKAFDKEGKFATMAPVLEKVITDEYFRIARQTGSDEDLKMARTMAWSLVYYLAYNHLDKLENYLAELSHLPRDMDLDPAVLRALFVKSFLGNASGLPRFANEWRYYMGKVELEDFPDVANARVEKNTKSKKPKKGKPPKQPNNLPNLPKNLPNQPKRPRGRG